MKHETQQSGQVVLIAVLTLVVAMTIVLALIARSTTDLRLTGEIEESARAFNAAEAGIAAALSAGTPQSFSVGADTSVVANPVAYGIGAGSYTLPRRTTKHVGETIFFVPHANGSLDVSVPFYTAPTLSLCWNPETVTPAMTAAVWYKDGSAYKVARAAFDPDATRRTKNSFPAADGPTAACGQSSVYRGTLTWSALGIDPSVQTLVLLRLRPVYSDAVIHVESAGPGLPSQGSRIESTGTTAGSVTRSIVVTKQYTAPSAMIDHVLYSQDDAIHN